MRDGFRSLTPAARLLVVNQLGINLGFYMVLPFLATYLRDDLGFGAALVGMVLGLRVLSQQGLFLVGGIAADRLGARPVIIAGCALRVVAFGLLAATTNVVGVVAAVMIVGVAGAIFSPAVRTFLIHESPGRRAETFAIFESAGNIGALTGPLLGAVLLGVDFRAVSLVACVVFGALTVAQMLRLPVQAVTPDAEQGTAAPTWHHGVLTNTRFLVFALAGSAFFALFNQLYLALPVELERVTGRPGAVSAVFVIFSVVSILGPVPLTTWCRRRWTSGRSMATGLALMGLSFVPLAISAPLTSTTDRALPLLETALAGASLLAATLALALGIVIVSPFAMALIPVVGSERLVGTYYGYYYLLSAIVASALSVVVGALLDLGGPFRAAPFLLMTVVGLSGAGVIAMLQRRGRLAPDPSAAPGPTPNG